MRNTRFFSLAALSLAFILSGCVTRTYQATRDRIDQDLGTGNRGYLQGSAPATAEAVSRKSTRDVRVVEIEFSSPFKDKKSQVAAPGVETRFSTTESTVPAEEAPAVSMQQYTVGKTDTLQKISKKFYGTTKKWYRIYQANKDVLKGPDKLYPGQVINVPVESSAPAAADEPLKETPENLK